MHESDQTTLKTRQKNNLKTKFLIGEIVFSNVYDVSKQKKHIAAERNIICFKFYEFVALNVKS